MPCPLPTGQSWTSTPTRDLPWARGHQVLEGRPASSHSGAAPKPFQQNQSLTGSNGRNGQSAKGEAATRAHPFMRVRGSNSSLPATHATTLLVTSYHEAKRAEPSVTPSLNDKCNFSVLIHTKNYKTFPAPNSCVTKIKAKPGRRRFTRVSGWHTQHSCLRRLQADRAAVRGLPEPSGCQAGLHPGCEHWAAGAAQ